MPKELTLKNNIEVLKVNIGEKTYSIPLATSLPYKKVKALIKLSKKGSEDEQLDAFIDFFKEYIPEEVIDELSITDLSLLAKSWSGASEKASGLSVGES